MVPISFFITTHAYNQLRHVRKRQPPSISFFYWFFSHFLFFCVFLLITHYLMINNLSHPFETIVD